MGLLCGKAGPDCTTYLQGQGCGRLKADSDIDGIGVSIGHKIHAGVKLTWSDYYCFCYYEPCEFDSRLRRPFVELSEGLPGQCY